MKFCGVKPKMTNINFFPIKKKAKFANILTWFFRQMVQKHRKRKSRYYEEGIDLLVFEAKREAFNSILTYW